MNGWKAKGDCHLFYKKYTVVYIQVLYRISSNKRPSDVYLVSKSTFYLSTEFFRNSVYLLLLTQFLNCLLSFTFYPLFIRSVLSFSKKNSVKFFMNVSYDKHLYRAYKKTRERPIKAYTVICSRVQLD